MNTAVYVQMAAAAQDNGWCLIESDPGVFASLVELLGVKGVSFAEVYGLDKETFSTIDSPNAHRKIIGFIFLFNWAKDARRTASYGTKTIIEPEGDDGPFFAAQVTYAFIYLFVYLIISL